MKRLVFCFDGTRNRLNADTPTNVVLTAASILRHTPDGITQIIHYDEGVGTGFLDYHIGSMVGLGLLANVREAYRFLILNYDAGDEIYVFGFSRGGFSAQTFVGLVRHVGPLSRFHVARIDEAMGLYRERLAGAEGASERMRHFRAKYSSKVCIGQEDDAWRCANIQGYQAGSAPILIIQYIGIWDAVSALGVPAVIPGSAWFNRRRAFHDPSLTAFVQRARHAVAIDERRALFPPVLWGDLTEINRAKGFKPEQSDAPYQEKWFPGTHGSVGGGGDIRGLSDGALNWILKGAKQAELRLDPDIGSRIHGFNPDPLTSLVNVSNPELDPMQAIPTDRDGPDHVWQVSAAAIRRWQAPANRLPEQKQYRPKPLAKVAAEIAALPIPGNVLGNAPLLAEHIVESGDELRKLAKRYYGDASKSDVIFQANRDTLDDPDDLFPNWKLRIPAL